VRSDRARFSLTLAAVLVAAGIYSSFYALRGWIPHDEGLLGQMAERVLDGELPHVDFDEPYSGGLTLLNAVSFSLFGHRLSSLRVTLFLFHLGFLASVFSIATRAGSLAAAALVTLLCLAWGPPNYFGGLPSWYNLGFAIFGIHVAIKYVETDRLGWVYLGGFLGGLSCLFKVAGIYLLLALFVFLIYRERVVAEAGGDASRAPSRPAWLVIAALVVPIAFLLAITWTRLGVMEVVYFILPGAGVCGLVAWNEVRQPSASRPPLGATVKSVLCLAFGAATPVILFLVPYILRNDVYSVYRGLFVLPQRRFDFAFYAVPPAFTILAAFPPLIALCMPLFTQIRVRVWMSAVVAGCLGVILIFASETPIYLAVWASVRPFGPIAAMLLCILLVQRDAELNAERKQLLLLMAAMAAFLSVIQFPYAFGLYFYYAAPPILLALLFAVSLGSRSWTKVQVCFVLFYVGFGVLWLNTANMRKTGVSYERSQATEVLLPERANLRVSEADKAVYDALVGVIREVAGDAPYILATPDCPEVYFLSGKKNPTRVFYEFFDPAQPTPQQLLADLASKGIRVVVLNGSPEFSEQVSQELFGLLSEAYPEHVDIGWFRVLWKT
jgi:hypothetical protein